MVELNQFLYLRIRSAFGLKAGGSVAHTAGVINSLAKSWELKVISNDYLPEVEVPYRRISPFRSKYIPVAITEFFFNIFLFFKLPKPLPGTIIYQRMSAYSFLGARLSNKNCPLVLEYNGSEVWNLINWSKQHNKKTIRGWFMNLYKYGLELPFVKAIERYNLKKAALIVVVSDELKYQLLKGGISRQRIVSYPNGVDPKKFSPGIESKQIRDTYNLQDSLVMGFIGSFGQWHGTDIMAKAIVEFYVNHPQAKHKVKFLLMGDGYMMSEVKRILQMLPNPEDVILTGIIPQNDAPKYLSACDVLVSPHKSNPDGTKFFGSPTKLFEYMALGKPIIASALEQIDDILSHGETAHMVVPDSPVALAQAFWEMSQDRSNHDAMGTAAREEVLKKYTWDMHVDQIISQLRLLNIAQ